jgi:hypothetical protein
VRHASGAARPTRRLAATGRLPALGAFQPGSVVVYHRNVDSDGLAVNETLFQQGVGGLVATTPDFWRDNQFGLALDAGGGPALVRAGPASLASAAPAAAFELRATALAVQTDSAAEWLAELAALVAAGRGAAAARADHEAWWMRFWQRSYIAVNMTNSSTPSDFGGGDSLSTEGRRFVVPRAAAPAAPAAGGAASGALPVPDALLWLRASTLAGSLANNSRVAVWPNDVPANGSGVAQAAAPNQPLFLSDGLGAGVPAVLFDGSTSFLENGDLATHRGDYSVVAVFRDDGSSGGSGAPCCSGVVFLRGSFNGISTVPAEANVDDDGQNAEGDPIVAFLDGPGTDFAGHSNIRGRAVVVHASYQQAGAALYVDDCLQVQAPHSGAPSAGGVQIGARNEQDGLSRFFRGALAEAVVFDHALTPNETAAMAAYFRAAYPSVQPQAKCSATSAGGFELSRAYALTRYVQAIQSRGTIWPLKFNGMAFVAAVNKGGGEPDYRDWGARVRLTRLPTRNPGLL